LLLGFAGLLAWSLPTILIAMLLGLLPSASFRASRNRGAGTIVLLPDRLQWRQRGATLDVPAARVVGGYLARKFRAPLGKAPAPRESPYRSVHLRLDNGEERQFDMETQADAERVMAHVDVDGARRAVVAPLRGVLGAFTRGLLAFTFSLPCFLMLLVSLAGPKMAIVAVAAAVAFTVFVVRSLGYPRAIVGSDGIRLTGRLLPKFVSFADIVDVQRTGGASPHGGSIDSGVAIVRKDGGTLSLPTIGQSPDEAQALVSRIRKGMQAYSKDPAERVRWALERRGRPVEAWRTDLKRVAETEGGFREQAIGRDDVERVLADPSAAADQRLGAALALRGMSDDAKVRIREAAATSANVRLRVALEAAADDEVDEAALEGALQAQRK
jgi:hypothetical protein